MRVHDVDQFCAFLQRMKPILEYEVYCPLPIKVTRNEYKMLHRLFATNKTTSILGFEPDNLQACDTQEEVDGFIDELRELNDFYDRVTNGLYDISTQFDIWRYPKNRRPAVQINQAERNILNLFEGHGRLFFNLDLYVTRDEVVTIPSKEYWVDGSNWPERKHRKNDYVTVLKTAVEV